MMGSGQISTAPSLLVMYIHSFYHDREKKKSPNVRLVKASKMYADELLGPRFLQQLRAFPLRCRPPISRCIYEETTRLVYKPGLKKASKKKWYR
jgi:hypothetical protein